MSFSLPFFRKLYRRSRSPEHLPWHNPQLPPFLTQALEELEGPQNVLDVGCGAGTFAIELARKGHRVTGLDFVPEAISLARTQGQKAGVEVDWLVSDVLEYSPGSRRFDLVLDSGCLHCLSRRESHRYRERLLEWLRPGGHFLLSHFEKRHALDWQPLGPRRLHHESVLRFFAPELRIHSYRSTFTRDRGPSAGHARPLAHYWFKARGGPAA